LDIVNAIRNDPPRLLISADAKVLDALQRIPPTYYQGIIAR
jgi:hypothetical protein